VEEIQPVGVILVGCLRRIRDWRPNVGLISGVVPWPSTSILAHSVTRPPVRLFVIGSGSTVSGFLRVLAWPGRCASTPSSARDPSSAKTTPPRGCRSIIILVSLCGYRGSPTSVALGPAYPASCSSTTMWGRCTCSDDLERAYQLCDEAHHRCCLLTIRRSSRGGYTPPSSDVVWHYDKRRTLSPILMDQRPAVRIIKATIITNYSTILHDVSLWKSFIRCYQCWVVPQKKYWQTNTVVPLHFNA